MALECLVPNNDDGGSEKPANGAVSVEQAASKAASLLASGRLTKVVDVTIAYPNGKPINLISIATGWDPPCATHVHYRVFDVNEVSY